ncbi:MAG: SDR family NAD(P)-dependent oxidoreductase [Anaerolineales bacterium]|nr:SDR family NAD(P)-dependent oxidoreductase [Anaerolineales bacterium]
MPPRDLSGLTVLITGASSGIGAAAARAFIQAGAQVALTARRADRLRALADELGPAAWPAAADLGTPDGPAQAVSAARARFGSIDVLVSNAGFGRRAALAEQTAAEVDEQVRVNLTAAMELTRLVLPEMTARGRGRLIYVASAAGLLGTPTLSVYGAAKAGLRAFAEAVRREAGPHGVGVSILSPGGVAGTEFGTRADPLGEAAVTTPAWLQLSTAQVAQAVVALARQPRREVIIPWPLAGLAGLGRHFPALADWVIGRALARRARG